MVKNQTTRKEIMKRSISSVYHLVFPVVLALLIGFTSYAQDKTGEIDKIFSWATPDKPGCVCAVSKNGKMVVNRAYGVADLERNVPLSQGTIFDIGSVRKQFIAAAVLILAEEKRLSLSDDIRRYIPQLHDYGHKIMVDHLLTHTSGLRDWTALLPLSGGDASVLTLILRQRGLNFAPGEEWSYSNSGYVLLTEVVERVSGMSFADFVRKRLFEPLGMKSSAYVTDILHGTGDRALGYQKEGDSWKQYMRLGNERGGGAVISTAPDLLIWNDALTNGRLGAFVTQKIQEPARLNNGRKLTYARGLNVNNYPGAKLISHSGGAAGYSTWLGRLPEHGLSVAVICNFDPVSATELAHKVINQFLPPGTAKATTPEINAGSTSLTVPDLNSRAGLYFSEPAGEPLRLVVNNGKLTIPGGTALVPLDNDRFRNPRGNLFFMSQDEFELNFLSPDQFELKSMEGQITRYRRAQSYVPSAGELKAFAGRFRSDEIGSVFLLEPKGDGLVIRLEHAKDKSLEFKPVDPDTFQWNRMMVRFHRDQSGNIIGFDFSNPLLRKVRFTRLGER